MGEPYTTCRWVIVERECHKVNPVALEVPIDGEASARKDKIQCDRYAEENDKCRQNAKSALHVESTDILADDRTFIFKRLSVIRKPESAKKIHSPIHPNR